MALPTLTPEKMIEQKLFDEVLRMSEVSAGQANRWHMVTSKLIDAMEETLDLMKSGRIDKARDRLANAAKAAAAVLR